MTKGFEQLSVGGIFALARERAADDLWCDESGMRTWAEFGTEIAAARQQLEALDLAPGSVVVTPGESTIATLAWLFAAAAAGLVVAPLRRERSGELSSWRNFVRIEGQVVEGRMVRVAEGVSSSAALRWFDELRARKNPGLILATGGTTGTPKLVLHDLAALLALVPVKTGRARRTLPLMHFDHIGGLDMAWRALAGGQVLVSPPGSRTPEAVAESIARHRVEIMPATPSFLNLLLIGGVSATHEMSSLRVVPYGAEPMPRGLLVRLRTAWPQVEFVERFGTSETGALPVRTSGEGLALEKNAADFAWKIVEGELWVRSPARALGYLAGPNAAFVADGWFATGDLAERHADGTVQVLGRRRALINVGGEKVLPETVEAVLLEHPLVADCHVGPAPNALLGQVVTAEIVWRGTESDPIVVKRLLHAFAGAALPKCNLPATVRLVRAIDTTGNLKKIRSSANETADHFRRRGLRT